MQWWARGKDVSSHCLDAIVPEYKGTDVYLGLQKIWRQYDFDHGLRIIEFSTHENNKLVIKLNLKSGAKFVRYFVPL